MNDNRLQDFQEVRDIPYRIPLSAAEVDDCCTGKHKRLKALLERAGLTVRWRVCTFRWSDINLPPEVSSIPHADDSSHAYLEVALNGSWIRIDATWDVGLSDFFTIAAWDGHSDTVVAVPYLDTYSPEESSSIIANETSEAIENDLRINGNFYKALNLWMARARANHIS